MSASRMPTLSPRSRNPRAKLTAVVDLPTPPLPDATAMMASTPGTPIGDGAPRPAPAGPAAREPPAPDGPAALDDGADALRSAVSATSADSTPGTARAAASARSRTDSQACTAAASTVIEKNTLPSLTITSDSFPLDVSGDPSGPAILARLSRTCCLVGAIVRLRLLRGLATRNHTGLIYGADIPIY